MRRAVAVLALGAALAGCGGEDGGAGDRLVVSAAASLTGALRDCSPGFAGADVRLSFAGSDELAAQIRRGVRPDVFAAANTQLPEQLAGEGLAERPRAFASNELVLVVRSGGDVRGLDDLVREGVTIAVGAEGVPVGAYTREVLDRLGGERERAILANVRTEEPDVRGVIGKLRQGAVDAGFAYRTDAVAAGRALRAIRLPERLRPAIAYAAAVVRGARNPEAAKRYLGDLVSGRCRAALDDAGFGPPP